MRVKIFYKNENKLMFEYFGISGKISSVQLDAQWVSVQLARMPCFDII